MPDSGSAPNKSFSRQVNVYTGTDAWQQLDTAGRAILAVDQDDEGNDIAAALNNRLMKDGGNWSVDVDIQGHKFTNVGAATARTQFASAAQIQDGSLTFVSAAGTGDAITLDLTPSISAYAAGQAFRFKATATNTGAATLNVDGVGAISIKKGGAGSTALAAGDVTSGGMYTVAYDGVNFQLENPGGGVAISDGGTGATTAAGAVENLITPLSEVTAAPGDLIPVSDASDNNDGKKVKASTIGAGKHTIWVPASAMYKLTAAAGPATGQFTASSFVGAYLAFDASSAEDANFLIAMPKGWDEGTVTAQTYWMHPSTTTNFAVLWQMFASAYSNDDAINGTTFGTATMLDTGGTTSDLYISPESSAITIGNSPAEGDLVHFILRRSASDGSDTLAVDAYLLGVKVFYTTNANTDD